MANSFAQTEELTCPNCQHSWSIEIWLVVDVNERPDLVELARSDKLHRIQCPHCQQELSLTAPLLLFWPSSTLPLAFFPTADQSQELNQQNGQFLIDTLYNNLGRAHWRDEWLADSLPSLAGALLPVLLKLPPGSAHLLQTITQLQSMANWYEVRLFLEQNPALLAPEVDDIYSRLIAGLERQGDDSARDYIADQELLRLCRAEGIAQALFDLTQPLPAPLHEQLEQAQAKVEALDEDRAPDPDVLNQAIMTLEAIRRASGFAEAGGQSHGIVMQSLGLALLKRYRVSADITDLNTAIDHLQTAVQLIPKAAFVNYAVSQRTLAQALEERYEQTSSGRDLDEAIAAHEAAVAVVKEDLAHLPKHLNSYARLLRERYGRQGSLADLEQATRAWQELMRLVDENTPNTIDYLNNLANAYRELYRRNSNDALLREAVAIHKHIVTLQPDEVDAHINLANAYIDEFWRFGYARELDKAIAGYERAMQLLDPQERPVGLQHNLARALYQRANLTGEVDDLLRAWRILSPLLDEASADAPHYPSLLNTVGTILQSVYENSGDETFLGGGIEAYQEAARIGLERATALVLNTVAPNWGNWAAQRSEWREAALAFAYGMEASERLYRQQLGRAAKELWLRDAQALPGLAAFVLAKADDYAGAVLSLERGRTRLLGEALRRDPENLARLSQGQYRPLYEQYTGIVEQIHALEAAPDQGDGRATDTLRQLRQQLDDVITAIQEIPEHADFLYQPSLAEIIAALTGSFDGQGVGVYITVTALGGLALLVHAQGIDAVWLEMDGATLDEVLRGPFREADMQRADAEGAALEALIAEQLPPEYRLRRVSPILALESATIAGGYLGGQLGLGELQAAITQALAEIGKSIVQPIAEKLEPILNKDGVVTPTLVLIPAGKLGLLPLAAAPFQLAGQQYTLLDRYTTLIAPGAEALLAARRRIGERRPGRSLLVIADPTETLPFAKWEQETVAAQFDEKAVIALTGNDANQEAVLIHATGQHYLHFACHAFYDWDQVMNSGLVLAAAAGANETDPLTLREMLLPSFKLDNSRLVVLSACETGLSEFAHTPEEYIGLPAALLQAGAPAVVSTLWAVNDLSTALLMERFYREHIAGGVGLAAALRRAQLWLREVSAGELADYFAAKRTAQADPSPVISTAWRRFATEEPESKPFGHPYYWAAFTFTGL